MCAVTPSHLCRDSFICEMRIFVCVVWHFHMRVVTHSCVRRDSCIRAPCLSNVTRDSCICTTTLSYVCHVSFMCCSPHCKGMPTCPEKLSVLHNRTDDTGDKQTYPAGLALATISSFLKSSGLFWKRAKSPAQKNSVYCITEQTYHVGHGLATMRRLLKSSSMFWKRAKSRIVVGLFCKRDLNIQSVH